MKITITKEYWVLADREKEYFLTEGDDWTPLIREALTFPSEEGAMLYNKTRSYELVGKNEVQPVKVKLTYEIQ